jgi:hypothetical protein
MMQNSGPMARMASPRAVGGRWLATWGVQSLYRWGQA